MLWNNKKMFAICQLKKPARDLYIEILLWTSSGGSTVESYHRASRDITGPKTVRIWLYSHKHIIHLKKKRLVINMSHSAFLKYKKKTKKSSCLTFQLRPWEQEQHNCGMVPVQVLWHPLPADLLEAASKPKGSIMFKMFKQIACLLQLNDMGILCIYIYIYVWIC